ncbi:hypothetical protein [Promicromonospora sp. NPDC019610]|uniref:hypothetical protein n=1 Tax=Promicromonospora sp. NPDC019610 TaxID=3364405 RepID=UPI0037BC7587
MTHPPRTRAASAYDTAPPMSDGEVLAAVAEMLDLLHDDDPNPALADLLERLPLSTLNLAKLIGTVAVQAAELSLRAAGVDTGVAADREAVAQVSLGYHNPPDDVPDWEKAAGALLVAACDFVLARRGHDTAQLDALGARSQDIPRRGLQFALLTLAELLTQIRRLLEGDLRGVVRR